MRVIQGSLYRFVKRITIVRKKIAQDKWRHFFVGIPMGFVLQAFMWFLFPEQPVLGTVIVLILVITISYGFELFSKITGKGHYEFNDALAAIIGGVLGMAIMALCGYLHLFT